MKKFVMVAIALSFLLSACAPNFRKEEEVVQGEKEGSKETAIIPKYQISDQYYRTILPFKPGEARGLVVNNLNTRYDINEFETGLMRIALNSFSPDKYYFQEGQYVKKQKLQLWLNRKFTDAQVTARVAAKKMKPEDNIGLNPSDEGVGETPMYLGHILEHNYLVKDDDGKVRLGGVVVGLALNSVHYYQKEKYGATYEKNIPHATLETEGKKLAIEVLKRLRATDGLREVPITIALFEQASRADVVPGNFFAYTHVSKGSNSISGWEKVEEKYYLFPSSEVKKEHRDDWTYFENFKQDVETYFPNFNGVVGKGFYVGNHLQELDISIPIQFYGKAEGIGFTQYVTGLVDRNFPDYINVQVSISSVSGQEALIVRNSDDDEPFVHIYK